MKRLLSVTNGFLFLTGMNTFYSFGKITYLIGFELACVIVAILPKSPKFLIRQQKKHTSKQLQNEPL